MPALSSYDEMNASGLKPDYVTFTVVLVACSHGGLVEDEWQIFKSIEEYNLELLLEHYGCIVDVLSRVGIRQPDHYHDSDYVLLSNAYGEVGKWVERARLRTSMIKKRISKKPSSSLINMGQKTSAVLYYVEDEEKEHNIGYHGEKLAVAFALLNFRDRKISKLCL
ncbi:E motif [Dillenia turbinata]|uniref:E motif n=1 Tax=Dillenia turbinata TaxID=194707 RepID=A0AAN8V2K5_9MAGN